MSLSFIDVDPFLPPGADKYSGTVQIKLRLPQPMVRETIGTLHATYPGLSGACAESLDLDVYGTPAQTAAIVLGRLLSRAPTSSAEPGARATESEMAKWPAARLLAEVRRLQMQIAQMRGALVAVHARAGSALEEVGMRT